MKIEQIRTFLAIVESGSFRAASERLYKTQPAITKSIQALEQSLGFELFDRSLHHPKLTRAGRTFHGAAQHFYAQYDRLSHVKESLKHDIEPVVNLAVDVCLPHAPLWACLSPCMERFAETEFKIQACTLNGGNESLLAGDVTLAITEHLYPDEPLEAVHLLDIPLVPVASPDFMAAYEPRLADPDQVWDTQQIILADTAQTRKRSFGVVEGHRRIVVNDNAYKHTLILSSVGWGRMPQWVVQGDIDAGRLQILHYPHIAHRYLPLSLVRPRQKTHGKVNEYVWEQLKALTH